MHWSITTRGTAAFLGLSIFTSTFAGSDQTEITSTTETKMATSALDATEIERVLALSDDFAYGEYLASECASCHSDQVVDGSNVPVIYGAPATLVARALLEYRSGYRTNTTMGNVASSLGDEEVAVLAHYLESL
jgi:cytochrome c553